MSKPKPETPPEEPAVELAFVKETLVNQRAKKPNRFSSAVKSLIDAGYIGSHEGLGFDLPLDEKPSRVRSELDRAGDEHGITVRWNHSENEPEDGRPPTRHYFIKVTKKIARKKDDEKDDDKLSPDANGV